MRAFFLVWLVALVSLAHCQDAVSLLKARNWTRNQKELVHERAWYYPALIEALKNPDEAVRSRAAMVLRMLDDQASIPALQEAFRSSKGSAKQESLWAILNLARPTEFGMHGEAFGLEKRSKAISDLGKDSVPYLIKWLRQLDDDSNYRVRLLMLAALADLKDSRSVDELLRQTNLLWGWELFHCFRALVELDDPRILPTLVREIYRGGIEDYVETVALWFLEKTPQKAYPYVLGGVVKHRYPQGRWLCIVFLLSQPENPRAHPVVLKATADKEVQVRRIAFTYFATFKYSAAEQAIRRGLRDLDESVREEAQKAAEANGIKGVQTPTSTSANPQ